MYVMFLTVGKVLSQKGIWWHIYQCTLKSQVCTLVQVGLFIMQSFLTKLMLLSKLIDLQFIKSKSHVSWDIKFRCIEKVIFSKTRTLNKWQLKERNNTNAIFVRKDFIEEIGCNAIQDISTDNQYKKT